MNKFWPVAWHEYSRHVFRKRFAASLLSLPVFLGLTTLILTITFFSEKLQPVGMVDLAGLNTDWRKDNFIPFANRAQAETALGQAKIQAYYVLQPGIIENGQAELVTTRALGGSYESTITVRVRQALLDRLPPAIAQRLQAGFRLVLETMDGRRRFTPEDWGNLLLPVLLLFVFILAIFSTSGYLMQAVCEEKENRTLEMVLSSMAPGQLLSGKIAGSLAVGITQIVAWLALIAAGVWLGVRIFGFRGEVNLSPGILLLASLQLLLALATLGALMAAVGAVVAEAAEGQQITGPFSLPFLLPFLFIFQIIAQPNSPLPVALSLLPFTAPVALTLRLGLVEVPAYQVAVSLALQLLTALLAFWLAGRFFRMGLLRYGQSLNLKQIFNGLRKNS